MAETDTKSSLFDRFTDRVEHLRYNVLMPPERKIETDRHPLEGTGLTYFRDPEDHHWLTLESASEFSQLKPNTIRHLAWNDRVNAIQPGGRDLFISYDSLVNYLQNGRKPGGRPRKNKT